LLVDVIGLEWDQVHEEACRWEHVMSDVVERRLVNLLNHPTESPYGNPIPGLEELGEAESGEAFLKSGVLSLREVMDDPDFLVAGSSASVVVRRIGEPAQGDPETMSRLRRAGVRPSGVVEVSRSSGGVSVGSGGEATEIDWDLATHVFVARAA
jgi:DtxR family Mn-dependent transcriptional regulator